MRYLADIYKSCGVLLYEWYGTRGPERGHLPLVACSFDSPKAAPLQRSSSFLSIPIHVTGINIVRLGYFLYEPVYTLLRIHHASFCSFRIGALFGVDDERLQTFGDQIRGLNNQQISPAASLQRCSRS